MPAAAEKVMQDDPLRCIDRAVRLSGGILCSGGDRVNANEFQALEAKADKAAELLTALGHSKRLMAMCRMIDEEVSVGALAEAVGLGQSALSQHLSKLRALGLVTTRREGQTIYYRLASPEARELITTLYRLYCV